MAKNIPFGPGMDQSAARRRAKKLSGIARSARPGRNGWIIGGWPHKDDVWIVVSPAAELLDDGAGEEQ